MKNLKPALYCLSGVIILLISIYSIYTFISGKNYYEKLQEYEIIMKVENREPSFDELKFSEEQLKIYYDISLLINGIQNNGSSEEDLVRLLDKLRNNLNHKVEIKALRNAINNKSENGGINFLGEKDRDTLNSILEILSNDSKIEFKGQTRYEKNKDEISQLLPYSRRSTIEGMFNSFEENLYIYESWERAEELNKIWDVIIKDSKKNKWYEGYFTPYFCNIFDYYGITDFTDKC